MYIPPNALRLAGFALGHAAEVAASLNEDELICPFAFIEKEGQRVQFAFESDSQLTSVKGGIERIKESPEIWDHWAFVWEGFINQQNKRTDALIVQFGFKRQMLPNQLVYPFLKTFSPKSFRLIGNPWLMVGSNIQEESDWEFEKELIMSGIAQHETAGSQWATWIDHGS